MELAGHSTILSMTSPWMAAKLSAKVHRCLGTRLARVGVLYFSKVKLPWPGVRNQAPFDDLYLTLFSPDSLHIIKHDRRTGVSTAGKQTGSSGHQIVVGAAAGQECWQSARSQILGKLLAAGHCELVARIDLSATEVRAFLAEQMEGMAARQDHEYKGVPLNHTGPELRGFQVEKIAFEVDQILHPNCF